ncbi:MAG: cation:proton antiporter domain-containing protein [Nocardioidaceae bacterium]
MNDVAPFGVVVLGVAAALLLAIASNRFSERVHVPAPALFLLAAALASDVFPVLGSLPLRTNERIVTVALIFILFDGGMQIGWARFRGAAVPILVVGVAGTVLTAAALSVLAHLLFGFDWRAALLLGAALAPTDPAVVFSVLGRREIAGRTKTILQGESGANDPVGIALMVALLGAAGGGWQAVGGGAATFGLQMVVGVGVGVAGGYLLQQFMRRVPLPNEALYPVRTAASAALIYGAADLLGGSGFLAVLLAGIVVGDARAPYKPEIERFSSALSSLAEIVVFTVLGLTVDLHQFVTTDELWVGLAIAALLILVVRPAMVGPLLLPARLRRGEKVFVLWGGLKGAVPILLGLFVLGAGIPDGHRIYGVVFVVVLVSVVVQGGLIPRFAHLLHIPMRTAQLEPWALGMRFQAEPEGLHRHFVAAGSAADGTAIENLDLGEDAWISMISRDGRMVQVRGGTVLRAGDEVLALGEVDVGRLFTDSEPSDPPEPPGAGEAGR